MHPSLFSSHFRPRRSRRLCLLSLGVLGFSLTAAAQYWQQAKLIGDGGVANQAQGAEVAISADGNTVIVGSLQDSGNIGAAWVDAGVVIPGSLTTLSHAGEAQFTTMFTGGQHEVSAEFKSSGEFQLSRSRSLTINVARAVSRTTIAAPLRPRSILTPTVSAEIGSPSPSGNVSLVDTVTQTILATGSLAGGQVEFSVPPSMVQSIMNHPVQAVYSGDVNFMASASDAISIQLSRKPPHFR